MLGGRKLATFSRTLFFAVVTVITFSPSTPLQFCGNDLANALALVCSETGYNIPPLSRQDSSQSSRDRRYARDTRIRRARGIVDECCRTSCSWSTIETYCQPNPSSTTSENLQIQKRSDPPSYTLFTEQVRSYSDSHFKSNGQGIRHEKKRLFGSTEDAIRQKNNRIFHSDVNGDTKKQLNHLNANKVKKNDEVKLSGNEIVSYRKTLVRNDSLNPEEGKADLAGNSAKTIRSSVRHHRSGKFRHLKNGKEGAQIGTVPPFFFGRTLVSPKARKTPFH